MNKRTFLKTTAVLTAGAIFPQLMSCKEKAAPRTNWAGNRGSYSNWAKNSGFKI